MLKAPSHPGQVTIGQLRAALTQSFPKILGDNIDPAKAFVWLPTLGGVPLARRGLFVGESALGQRVAPLATRENLQGHNLQSQSVEDQTLQGPSRDIEGGTPSLALWQVAGVALSPADALIFLSQLDNVSARSANSRIASGSRMTLGRLRFSNDLLYWSNAAKFALELLVGQHYLPSMRVDSGGRLRALWQPLLLEPRVEQQRDQLVKVMPPICRAYNILSPDDALPARMLTEDFVATVVDDAVRTWGEVPVAPNARGNEAPDSTSNSTPPTTSAPSPAYQWLKRLLSDQPLLSLPPQPAHELFGEWRHWTEFLFVVRDANFRICFILEDPHLEMTDPRAVDGLDDEGALTEDTLRDSAEDGHENDARWKLHFYLQARDDPNLMVSAREVWRSTNNRVRVGNRHVDQPQERLLAGLGVASRLFAPIEESLRNPRPEVSLLSTDQAYLFLREIGPLLESSGFGIILPHWWNAEQRARLGLRLRLSGLGGDDGLPDEFFWGDELADGNGTGYEDAGFNRSGFNSHVNYQWELTLGGERLQEAEFERLSRVRSPLLRLRGQWVELEPQQIDAAKRFLRSLKPSGVTSLLQAIRLSQAYAIDADAERDVYAGSYFQGEIDIPAEIAPSVEVTESLAVDVVDVAGWLEGVLTRLRSQQPLASIAEPNGFVGELRPYQRYGVGWLAHLRRLGLGACLADDMGLGKTIQAIALLLHLRQRSNPVNGTGTHRPGDAHAGHLTDDDGGIATSAALLICPTSVVANWRREIERFAPGLRAMVHHGTGRFSGDAFIEVVDEYDLVITSFGTARRDIELLQRFFWTDLILDEAQNIKNPTAKQTRAVRRLRGHNRMALTGTPVENRLSELWSIMEFLNPGYLGTLEYFRQHFVVPIERYNDEQRTEKLRRLVQPFLLRRLKSDPQIISDLPEKNEMIVYCTLTQEQAQLYQHVVDDAMAVLEASEGIKRRGLVLALLTKLKQITNHPAHFLKEKEPLSGRSGKLARLSEMLEEALSVGDRALIFTQFVEMGRLLQRHLQEKMGIETLFLHGGTPAPQRDKMVQLFQSEDGPPVFLLSLRAGGSGLNLTQANHVFHYDRWWNPAVENQATDRAFRIGQQRNVQVHKFVVAGTLEERVHELIESKQALAQSIVGSGEEWLTELDTDELRSLLTLRQDGIEDEG